MVPTVLVTGGPDAAEEDLRLRSQIYGMLFKPFDPHALLTAMDTAVSHGK